MDGHLRKFQKLSLSILMFCNQQKAATTVVYIADSTSKFKKLM